MTSKIPKSQILNPKSLEEKMKKKEKKRRERKNGKKENRKKKNQTSIPTFRHSRLQSACRLFRHSSSSHAQYAINFARKTDFGNRQRIWVAPAKYWFFMAHYGSTSVWSLHIMIEGCIVAKLVLGKFKIVGYLHDKHGRIVRQASPSCCLLGKFTCELFKTSITSFHPLI